RRGAHVRAPDAGVGPRCTPLARSTAYHAGRRKCRTCPGKSCASGTLQSRPAAALGSRPSRTRPPAARPSRSSKSEPKTMHLRLFSGTRKDGGVLRPDRHGKAPARKSAGTEKRRHGKAQAPKSAGTEKGPDGKGPARRRSAPVPAEAPSAVLRRQRRWVANVALPSAVLHGQREPARL